jgi:hypothetical protein
MELAVHLRGVDGAATSHIGELLEPQPILQNELDVLG